MEVRKTKEQIIEDLKKKYSNVNLNDIIIKKEISSVKNALFYLRQLDFKKIDTFSLTNSNLEEIFLRLVYNENINL